MAAGSFEAASTAVGDGAAMGSSVAVSVTAIVGWRVAAGVGAFVSVSVGGRVGVIAAAGIRAGVLVATGVRNGVASSTGGTGVTVAGIEVPVGAVVSDPQARIKAASRPQTMITACALIFPAQRGLSEG